MKNHAILLPLAAALAAVLAPAHAGSQEEALRVEPVVSVRHSEPGAEAWYKVGLHQQQANQLELAADSYRQALAIDAAHVEARNALATVYSLQHDTDAAIAELHALLGAHPNLAHLHNNLGYTYYLKADYLKAISALGKAISLEPGNRRAFANLKLAYARLGDGEQPAAAAQVAQVAQAAPAAPAAPATPAMHATVTATKETPDAGQMQPAPQADASDAVQAANAPADMMLPLHGVVIEIANGTTDTRLGESLAEALRHEGATVTRVAGLKPYTQRRNVITYRDGYQEQAQLLSQHFTIPPAIVKDTRPQVAPDMPGLRLILGQAALQAAGGAGN